MRNHKFNEQKTIIASDRAFNNLELAEQLISDYIESLKGKGFMSIVFGKDRRTVTIGEVYASKHRLVDYGFCANWKAYGQSAEIKRNQTMADFSDALLAFWDGRSAVVGNMIRVMMMADKPVTVHRYKLENRRVIPLGKYGTQELKALLH